MKDFVIYVSSLIVKDEKILLVKEVKEAVKGKWNLPGGHLEKNENLVSGAVREVFEETGLSIKINSLLGIYISRSNIHSFRFVFNAEITSSEINKSELEWKWLNPDEIAPLDLLDPEKILKIISDHTKSIQIPLTALKEFEY